MGTTHTSLGIHTPTWGVSRPCNHQAGSSSFPEEAQGEWAPLTDLDHFLTAPPAHPQPSAAVSPYRGLRGPDPSLAGRKQAMRL